MVLPDVFKLFTQSLLAKRYVTDNEALDIFRSVSGRDSCNKNDVDKAVDQVNRDIKKYHIEIKSQICEITGQNYYAIVSNLPSLNEAYDKCVHAYSVQERDYFRSVMEEIITAEDRCITRNTALNLTVANSSQSQNTWGPHLYNKCLLRFVEDGWLVSLEGEGKLYLGARAIAELEHTLMTVYKVETCKLCSHVCIVGFVCDNCSIMAHDHCVRTYRKKKATNNDCIKCGNPMRHT